MCVLVSVVTLPSRRASIRPGNLDGARAERSRQKNIARAVSKSPERRAIIIFRAIINLFFCIIFFTSGNPPEGNRKRPKKNPCYDSRHDISYLRFENGEDAGGTGQRRVAGGFRPLQLKAEKQQRTSCFEPR